MYEFNYRRANSVFDAVESSARAEDASYLAGGMTLIPVLKFRLAGPSDVIDLAGLSDGSLGDFRGVRVSDRFIANATKAESFGHVVGSGLQPLIIEHQVLGTHMFQKEFSVVGTRGGIPKEMECGVSVDIGIEWPEFLFPDHILSSLSSMYGTGNSGFT